MFLDGDVPKPGESSKTDKQLVSRLLRNLALLHATGEGDSAYDKLLDRLEQEYVDHHAWDWYRDENMPGAFAYFGPGQYSNMWQEIIKSNSFGQLYLIGEAASSHHAWIVGALEASSVRRISCSRVSSRASQTSSHTSRPMELLKLGLFDGQNPETIDKKKLPFWPLPSEMPY